MTSDKKDDSLQQLAEHLLQKGPEKTFPSARRVRLFLNGACIADTTAAVYVWEKPWYPWYYIPRKDILQASAASPSHIECEQGAEVSLGEGKAGARFWKISVGDRSTGWRVLEFQSSALDGLVRVDFSAVDQWFEEDLPFQVHPKDPFKRVDVLPSSRHIRVSTKDGHLLADTHFSMHLHETLLQTRFYLPLTAVNRPSVQLKASSTKTSCPYKGIASYYDVVVPGGEVLKDVIWYYDSPNLECAGIAGLACFYNEKVEIEIDGVKLKKH